MNKKIKISIYKVVMLGILAVAVVGCTFAGERDYRETTPESTANQENETKTTTEEQTTTEKPTTTEDPTTTEKPTTVEEPTTTNIEEIKTIEPAFNLSVAAGYGSVIAIDSEGKAVISTSSEDGVTAKDLEGWDNLVEVSANEDFLMGLKSDGSVVSYGKELKAYRWRDIVSIEAGVGGILGLRKDGKIVYDDYYKIDYDLLSTFNTWTDIVQLDSGDYDWFVGLKEDGTVVATGDNEFGQCEVTNWTDVVMVAAGRNHVVGLRSDGTVLAAGVSFLGQCDVAEWKDIVFVAAGNDFTLGVKNDGTVVATGYNMDKLCKGMEAWTNIAYVTIGETAVAGVTKDGQVLIAGYYKENYDESKFKNMAVSEINFDIDFTRQLEPVEQKKLDLEVKSFDWNYEYELTYYEPENCIVQAGNFSFKVPEEMADKIIYTRGENAVSVLLKNDLYYTYNSDYNCIEYSYPLVSSVVRNTDAQDLFLALTPSYIIGDDTVKEKVRAYYDAVEKELLEIAKGENKTDYYDISELYYEYEDRITVESYVFYTSNPPSDMPLFRSENAKDYFEAIEWFETSVEIIE